MWFFCHDKAFELKNAVGWRSRNLFANRHLLQTFYPVFAHISNNWLFIVLGGRWRSCLVVVEVTVACILCLVIKGKIFLMLFCNKVFGDAQPWISISVGHAVTDVGLYFMFIILSWVVYTLNYHNLSRGSGEWTRHKAKVVGFVRVVAVGKLFCWSF